MENPMDQLKKLRDAVDRMAESLDLERIDFVVHPGDESGRPDVVAVAFRINPKALLNMEQLEQLEYDSNFADLIKHFDTPPEELQEPEDPKQAMINELRAELEQELKDDTEW